MDFGDIIGWRRGGECERSQMSELKDYVCEYDNKEGELPFFEGNFNHRKVKSKNFGIFKIRLE